jgi:glycosyltransferase involved in cell wall biosynthesis
MNILFLVDIVPYPPNTGHKIRTFNIIKQLSEKHNIYLLAFNQKIMINNPEQMQSYEKELEKYCKEVHTFPIPSDRNKFSYFYCLGQNLLQLKPYRVNRYQSKEYSEKILEILNLIKIDLVHLDKTEFFEYKKLFKDIPAVSTNHNIESELMRQRSKKEVSLSRRLFAFIQYIKTKRYEKKALSKLDGYITCTEIDHQFLKNQLNIHSPYRVIDNGVDISYYKSKGLDEENYVLIIGAQSKEATANYDATMYFIKNIWPRVTRKNKLLKLKIVGRHPDNTILDLEKDHHNVEVIGFVQDERELLEKAIALLVPLRIGGGSRLKIITAMALGKAIISTTKGAEGIHYTNNSDIIISDDPDLFAKNILKVVENTEFRSFIGKNALKLVQDFYDWNKIGKELLNFYDELVYGAR